MMEFQDVAKKIIKNSIKKAILIDDDAILPFSNNEDKANLCRDLYDKFRDNYSVLEFLPFKGDDTDDVNNRLKSEYDLVLLDWELEKDMPRQVKTLETLERIINQQNIHFVCIYTHVDKNKFKNILYSIIAFFKGHKIDNYNSIIDLFDLETDVDKELFNDFSGKFIDLVLEERRCGEILQELDESLKELNEPAVKKIYELSESRPEALKLFGYMLNGAVFKKLSETNYDIIVYPEDNYLVINNTIVALHSKSELEPVNFISGFTDTITKSRHSFLSVLSLEFRNMLTQQSALISKEIKSIDESAFFHHHSTVDTIEEFNDFVIELWKNDSTSFLKSFLPETLASLESYKVYKNITDLVETKTINGSINKDLGKLNCYYNLTTKYFDVGKLSFGDVFIQYSGDEIVGSMLCITSHCDCLRPEKINDNFFFIKGSKPHSLNKKVLEEADSEYKSFVNYQNNPMVIEWLSKPFTIYISERNNEKSNAINVKIEDKDYQLKYHCSLKENYAQRIANHSYSYANRVGINFAKLKKIAN